MRRFENNLTHIDHIKNWNMLFFIIELRPFRPGIWFLINPLLKLLLMPKRHFLPPVRSMLDFYYFHSLFRED
jgi:hypothetical protein